MEWEVLSVFVTPPKLPPERAPRRRPLRVGLVGRWMGGWLGANPLRVLKQVPFVWVSEFHTNRPQCQWGEVVGRGSKKKKSGIWRAWGVCSWTDHTQRDSISSPSFLWGHWKKKKGQELDQFIWVHWVILHALFLIAPPCGCGAVRVNTGP